jgi:hypothetical protein
VSSHCYVLRLKMCTKISGRGELSQQLFESGRLHVLHLGSCSFGLMSQLLARTSMVSKQSISSRQSKVLLKDLWSLRKFWIRLSVVCHLFRLQLVV